MADTEEELLAGGDNGVTIDHVDEDKLLNEEVGNNENPFDKEIKEELDLFDAAIEPSGAEKEIPAQTNNTSAPTTPVITASATQPSFSTSAQNLAALTGKKFCCYIGNMTWWTTDEDLQKAVATVGPNDLVDLKFYENRTNGQSKGFCLAVFLTEQSVRTITEKLPLRPVHGQTLVVLPYSKISLSRLEEASAKTQTRADQKKEEPQMLNMGTIRISANGIAPMGGAGGQMMGGAGAPMMGGRMNLMGAGPQMGGGMMGGNMMMGNRGAMMGQQPQQMQRQPMQMGMVGRIGGVQMGMAQPPPGMGQPPPGGMVMSRPPPGMGQSAPPPTGPPQPLMGRPVGAPPNVGSAGFPAGAHINPNVYPGFQQGAGDAGAPLTEAETEEIMNRNRTISSSAISRAISDATSGDHAGAIDTLLTAISLIKQSRAAADERCKLLISSLHDTLSGIEAKMKERKRDRRDRSRSRSRERKHRRRSRSRSRSPRRKY